MPVWLGQHKDQGVMFSDYLPLLKCPESYADRWNKHDDDVVDRDRERVLDRCWQQAFTGFTRFFRINM